MPAYLPSLEILNIIFIQDDMTIIQSNDANINKYFKQLKFMVSTSEQKEQIKKIIVNVSKRFLSVDHMNDIMETNKDITINFL